MTIRVHVSPLSDEARLEKLGVKRRARPCELERQHQVRLDKMGEIGKGCLSGNQTTVSFWGTGLTSLS